MGREPEKVNPIDPKIKTLELGPLPKERKVVDISQLIKPDRDNPQKGP